jgi:hypothetical protein
MASEHLYKGPPRVDICANQHKQEWETYQGGNRAILVQCPARRTKQKVNDKGCRCGEDLDKAKKANRA